MELLHRTFACALIAALALEPALAPGLAWAAGPRVCAPSGARPKSPPPKATPYDPCLFPTLQSIPAWVNEFDGELDTCRKARPQIDAFRSACMQAGGPDGGRGGHVFGDAQLRALQANLDEQLLLARATELYNASAVHTDRLGQFAAGNDQMVKDFAAAWRNIYSGKVPGISPRARANLATLGQSDRSVFLNPELRGLLDTRIQVVEKLRKEYFKLSQQPYAEAGRKLGPFHDVIRAATMLKLFEDPGYHERIVAAIHGNMLHDRGANPTMDFGKLLRSMRTSISLKDQETVLKLMAKPSAGAKPPAGGKPAPGAMDRSRLLVPSPAMCKPGTVSCHNGGLTPAQMAEKARQDKEIEQIESYLKQQKDAILASYPQLSAGGGITGSLFNGGLDWDLVNDAYGTFRNSLGPSDAARDRAMDDVVQELFGSSRGPLQKGDIEARKQVMDRLIVDKVQPRITGRKQDHTQASVDATRSFQRMSARFTDKTGDLIQNELQQKMREAAENPREILADPKSTLDTMRALNFGKSRYARWMKASLAAEYCQRAESDAAYRQRMAYIKGGIVVLVIVATAIPSGGTSVAAGATLVGVAVQAHTTYEAAAAQHDAYDRYLRGSGTFSAARDAHGQVVEAAGQTAVAVFSGATTLRGMALANRIEKAGELGQLSKIPALQRQARIVGRLDVAIDSSQFAQSAYGLVTKDAKDRGIMDWVGAGLDLAALKVSVHGLKTNGVAHVPIYDASGAKVGSFKF